jgi:hypothetical protein
VFLGKRTARECRAKQKQAAYQDIGFGDTMISLVFLKFGRKNLRGDGGLFLQCGGSAYTYFKGHFPVEGAIEYQPTLIWLVRTTLHLT